MRELRLLKSLQQFQGELIEDLINDVWRSFECSNNNEICEVLFTDEEYSRDSLYYVRAIQEETLSINGRQIHLDDYGNVKICKGSYNTETKDDCLFPTSERAWSSPIFINKP